VIVFGAEVNWWVAKRRETKVIEVPSSEPAARTA